MGGPRDILNLGVHIGSRNIASGSVPESAPSLAGDGYPLTVRLPSMVTITPPNVACLVDFEGGSSPTATIAAYGYFPDEAPELLSAWQKLVEVAVSEATNPYLLFFAAGANRVQVVVTAITGSPTSVRLGLRGVTGPLPSEGEDGSGPSPAADEHTAEANCLATDNEGDLVYITSDAVGGKIQVSKADATDNNKMPVVGMIVTKNSPTDCIVRFSGETSLLGGLTSGRHYYVNSSGGVSLTPPGGPGLRWAQVVGVALASNIFWIEPNPQRITLI